MSAIISNVQFTHTKKCIGILLLVMVSFSLSAATYYSRVSGVFNTASTWSVNPSGTPTNTTAITNSDIFIIQNTHTVSMGANRTVAQITINTGGTLAVAARILTVTGNWVNNGTISGSTGGLTGNTGTHTNNGTILFTGAGKFVITTGSLTNNGSITIPAGTLSQTTGSITNSATGTITKTGAGTVTFGTGNFINNNTSASVNFGTKPIIISGTAASQTIGGFTTTGRFSCTKTSGTVTLTGDLNVTGITMNGSGGTLNLGTGFVHTTLGTVILTAGTMNGGSSTLNVTIVSTAAWQGTATVFVPGTGTVNFNAAGNQTLSASGVKTFYNLTFSNSGVKTDANTTVNNVLSMEGTATASAAPTYGSSATLQYNTATGRTAGVEWITPFAASGGVIIANTGAITANGAKVFNASVPLTINSGATLTTGANAFTFNGDLVNNGTWTSSTGDITISGTATQSIGTFNTTGTVSMTKTGGTATFTGGENGGAFTLNGSGGTLNLGTGLTHSFSGTWTNTAGTLVGNTSTLNIDGTSTGTGVSFTANTSTVNFTGASAQSIPAFTYYDVNFSGAGVKTLSGTTGSSHVLTINASSELDLSSMTLNLSGSGTPLVNNGTFTASTSTVNYTNAGSTVITAVNYNNLNGTGGNRTLSTTANIGIAGTFTPGAGTYTVTNSTVDFNGSSAQTIPAFTFYYLIVSNAGIKSVLSSTTVICQTLDINNSASIEINSDGGAQVNVLQ